MASEMASSKRRRHLETRANLELTGKLADKMDRMADGLHAKTFRLARTTRRANGERPEGDYAPSP